MQKKSWLHYTPDTHFPLQNIPFGIFCVNGEPPRAGTRIGDSVIDLSVMANAGLFDDIDVDAELFAKPVLNDFIAAGKSITGAVRHKIIELFDEGNSTLKSRIALHDQIIYPLSAVQILMPVFVPDYTDFYSSIDHAMNVGKMFRDPENALLPNWKHLPVGYHGRASSIVVSGTPLHRPKGQTKADSEVMPQFGPSKLLDFELEVAFITGKNTALAQSVSVAEAEDYIFGLVLFNDWSARDIQKWEYVPLGPFLGKNFGSSISPWIVTLEALEPFRVEGAVQEPEVLPYLQFEGKKNYDIHLSVSIQPPNCEAKEVSRSNFRHMYWNMCQQLAHHTVNGCNLRVGDMYASGTISGPTPDSFGSMLEISWQGKNPVVMPDGSERRFIQDFDTVIMSGFGELNGVRIGFGEVSTQILPAL